MDDFIAFWRMAVAYILITAGFALFYGCTPGSLMFLLLACLLLIVSLFFAKAELNGKA